MAIQTEYGVTPADIQADLERGPRRSLLTIVRLILAGQWSR